MKLSRTKSAKRLSAGEREGEKERRERGRGGRELGKSAVAFHGDDGGDDIQYICANPYCIIRLLYSSVLLCTYSNTYQ